jgi:hypothetical protein
VIRHSEIIDIGPGIVGWQHRQLPRFCVSRGAPVRRDVAWSQKGTVCKLATDGVWVVPQRSETRERLCRRRRAVSGHTKAEPPEKFLRKLACQIDDGMLAPGDSKRSS